MKVEEGSSSQSLSKKQQVGKRQRLARVNGFRWILPDLIQFLILVIPFSRLKKKSRGDAKEAPKRYDKRVK